MSDIIPRLRGLAAGGSKAEKRLSNLVLSDIAYASKAPIADLAVRAKVSEPSVTRFCRALGCEGVRDFKFRLAQVLAIGGIYLFPEPLAHDERDTRIINAVCEGTKAAIERVRSAIDMRHVNLVAERLIKARQILAFGSGGVSSMGAVELQNRLFRLGLAVMAYTDGQMQRMAAAVSNPDTVVVAISSSGYAASVVEATHVARRYGAQTISITNPTSDLAGEAEINLGFSIPADTNIYKPTSGRYALLMIIDLIATATAEMLGPSVLEGLRRIRTSLSSLEMSDPGRPIGD